jgi:hypothetical protein
MSQRLRQVLVTSGVLVTASVFLSTAGAPRVRAQVPADAVYEDAKQIIEELLTTEVSQTSATHLACLSGRKKVYKTPTSIDITTDLSKKGAVERPKDVYVELEAIKYFPRLFQAIYDKQFASIRAVALSESAGLIGDVAYQLMKAADDVEPISTPIAAAAPGIVAAQKSAAAVVLQTKVAAAAPEAQTRALALRTQAALAAPSTVVSSEAPDAKTGVGGAIEFAPLKDERVTWRDVIPFANPLQEEALDICANNLGRLLANNGLGQSATALDQDCQKTPRDEYACDMGYALKDALENDQKDAEGYVVRALAEFLDEVALKKAPTDDQRTTTIAAVSAMLNATGSTADIVAAASNALTKALGGAPSNVLLESTIDEWKVLHLTSGNSTVAAFLADATGGVAAVIADGCKTAPTAKACAFFTHEKHVLGVGADLAAAVRLARSGNEIDSAQLAIDELFTDLKANCAKTEFNDEAACEMFPFYKRFADAVVVYVVEAHTSGTPSADARAVVRTATVDMVRALGVDGGIDRNTFSLGLVLPDLSLRYEWSQSFVNVNPGARSVASATWLKLRRKLFRGEMGYTAVTLSLVDLLAPLSEIAARASVTYTNDDKIWWNLLSPHLDIDGGIPALSKHLLVGGGVSYRFVAPWQTVAPTMTTPASYEYSGCRGHSAWANCLEFGVFAKYAI